MVRRVTITIDAEIESKIRKIQAKQITHSNKAISFSSVIDQLLKKGLNETS